MDPSPGRFDPDGTLVIFQALCFTEVRTMKTLVFDVAGVVVVGGEGCLLSAQRCLPPRFRFNAGWPQAFYDALRTQCMTFFLQHILNIRLYERS